MFKQLRLTIKSPLGLGFLSCCLKVKLSQPSSCPNGLIDWQTSCLTTVLTRLGPAQSIVILEKFCSKVLYSPCIMNANATTPIMAILVIWSTYCCGASLSEILKYLGSETKSNCNYLTVYIAQLCGENTQNAKNLFLTAYFILFSEFNEKKIPCTCNILKKSVYFRRFIA